MYLRTLLHSQEESFEGKRLGALSVPRRSQCDGYGRSIACNEHGSPSGSATGTEGAAVSDGPPSGSANEALSYSLLEPPPAAPLAQALARSSPRMERAIIAENLRRRKPDEVAEILLLAGFVPEGKILPAAPSSLAGDADGAAKRGSACASRAAAE